MKKYNFEDVYFTMLGEVHGSHAVPGVPNVYFDGGKCDRLYNEVMDAYARLRQRLGVQEEDTDVEILINHLLSI